MGLLLAVFLLLPGVTSSRNPGGSANANTDAMEPLKAGIQWSAAKPASIAEPVLPPGFHAVWIPVTLDSGRIRLNLLEKGFFLGETRQGLGAEVFSHHAYLYRQLARQVPEEAQRLEALADKAEHLGLLVFESAKRRFHGLPSADLSHLKIQAELTDRLEMMNLQALHLADRDVKGRLFPNQTHTIGSPGPLLADFLSLSDALQASRVFSSRPETRSLLARLQDNLKRVALHLEVDWTTVFQDAELERALEMNIQSRQTLSAGYLGVPTAQAFLNEESAKRGLERGSA